MLIPQPRLTYPVNKNYLIFTLNVEKEMRKQLETYTPKLLRDPSRLRSAQRDAALQLEILHHLRSELPSDILSDEEWTQASRLLRIHIEDVLTCRGEAGGAPPDLCRIFACPYENELDDVHQDDDGTPDMGLRYRSLPPLSMLEIRHV